MFRLENNVPDVYVEESRDFQMFCRAYDFIFNSTKFNIDSIQTVTSTKLCSDRLLELLGTKIGLFTNMDELSDRELRYVLAVYPDIIKYKGSLRAVKYILNIVARLNKLHPNRFYSINTSHMKSDHVLIIHYVESARGTAVMRKLIYEILPVGYLLELIPVGSISSPSTQFVLNDTYALTEKRNQITAYNNGQPVAADNGGYSLTLTQEKFIKQEEGGN